MKLESKTYHRSGNRRGAVHQILFLAAIIVGSIGFAVIRIVSVSGTSLTDERSVREPGSSVLEETTYGTTIRQPNGPPRTPLGKSDASGEPISVACSTCHTNREPNRSNHSQKDFDEFHSEFSVSHGDLKCLSCHNEEDYDSLKLASGTRVDYTDVMTLCAQCHGQQMRDFEHGAHGGMTGFWDLKRGPRTKNNCIDCHPPHHPKFPKMRPTFKPKDRFLSGEEKSHE